MTYFTELCFAMNMLAEDPRTVFVGQGVGNAGTTMSATFDGVLADKRIEMPVAEDMQMGICTGMSLTGIIPVCIFPRWNFMLLAANQLVNHLDRLSLFSEYRPKVIIRVATPSIAPFYPGPQHDDDFTKAFRLMLRTTDVVSLEHEHDIVHQYAKALHSPRSTVLVEFTDQYVDDIAKERAG